MNKFLKQSEEKLLDLKKNIQEKQEGRRPKSLISSLGGGIGRREGLKIPWPNRPCRFDSGPRQTP